MSTNEKLLAFYRAKFGLREAPGPSSTAELLAIIRRWVPWARDDSTTAWCGILRAEAAVATGTAAPEHPERERSWLSVGETIRLADAISGDTVVIRRGPGLWHVGLLVISSAPGDLFVDVIGGNQRNGVSVAPFLRHDILGIRRIS